MRRPQSAFGFIAVMVSLLVVLIVSAPVTARSSVQGHRFPRVATRTPEALELAHTAREARKAGTTDDECTGWRSDRTPPPTIRVLRAKKREGVDKDVVGTVAEVPFREYVGVVLAAEWPDHYPLETIKAGAVAVKQYAWYYAIVYRGGEVELEDGTKQCYDLEDTTNDQVYYPEEWSPSAKHRAAIDATWDMTVRKLSQADGTSRMFLTGYRNGETVACGADATGWKLFQQSAKRCGVAGLKVREILRTYLSPRLEIVTTGRHDIVGTERGDAAAFVSNEQAELVAHVWTPGSTPPTTGSRTARVLSEESLVGAVSSDVDGDGRDDLLWLRKDDARMGKLRVARSTGVDYGEPTSWYEGSTRARLAGAILLAGDFNADGRRDAAILARGEEPGTAVFHVYRRQGGTRFREPSRWWSGSLDLDRVRDAWAGDVTGDGRADLIVREDPEEGGVRIHVAVAKRPSPGLGDLRTRFEDPGLEADKTLIIPGDADRDGREDLLMVFRAHGPGQIDRLRGTNRGALTRSKLWTAPRGDPIPIRQTRLGAADVDYDGITDLLLFSAAGDGARIRVLRTRYTGMKAGLDIDEGSLDWSRVTPY